MQIIFKFYLHVFTGVLCGLLMSRGRCPIFKLFLPKSYKSYTHLNSQPLLLSVSVVLPNLQEGVEQELCL